MDANKKICLDEVSLRLIHSLTTERLKMGLSMRKLAKILGGDFRSVWMFENGRKFPPLCKLIKLSEIFGYDISSSVNYKYWHGKIDWQELRQQLVYYGLTCRELSGYVGYDEATVSRVFRQASDLSLDCLNAILGVFEDERRLLKFHEELLRRKTPARREWWKRTKAPSKPNSGRRELWQWPF